MIELDEKELKMKSLNKEGKLTYSNLEEFKLDKNLDSWIDIHTIDIQQISQFFQINNEFQEVETLKKLKDGAIYLATETFNHQWVHIILSKNCIYSFHSKRLKFT